MSQPLSYLTFTNRVASPVEVVQSFSRSGQENILSANVTTYAPNSNNNGSLMPSKDYRLETYGFIPASQYANYAVTYVGGNESDNIDSRMKLYRGYNLYDQYNNLLQAEESALSGKYQSYLFGYGGSQKIAEVENSNSSSIAYSSFESEDKGNWTYSGDPVFDITSQTGTKYYDLSRGGINSPLLTSANTYVVSYWTKNSAPFSISGTQGAAALLATRNGWNNYRHKVSGVTNLSLSGAGYVDELRLYPLGARMATYTYEPLVGITSKNDENNQSTYYDYDEYNRLMFIKDNNKNISQAFCYNANGEVTGCFLNFTNSEKTGTFYRSNCTPGHAGTQVLYTVPAGRYSANSQAIADAMAQYDVDQNGQAYANANGTCGTETIYARVEISNYNNQSFYTDPDNYEDYTYGDIRISLYSDNTCTTPYTLTGPMVAVVTNGYSLNGMPGTSSDVSYNIPSGVNSYLVQSGAVIEDHYTYTDPYSGSGHITDNLLYSFDLKNNGTYYISLPTHY